ncbi:MAG: NADH-quinone oxidoreductase subunit D [Chloroflexi bacterium]|nr:NADH-quinone oxidoreductase subunit D [Chloroflexota bacterium]
MVEALKTQQITLNLGPQHPSTHGVFRAILTLEGEVVVDAEPIVGYLHRAIEKLGEERTYLQGMPLTDRLDYVSAMPNNLAYALAVEQLADIAVPERAQYLRVIMAELNRIASHLVAIGTFTSDLGAFYTPFLYMLRDREYILDLFEMACGQRLTYNYVRFGGVSRDVTEEFIAKARQFVDYMPPRIDEYEALLTRNEIFLSRTKGIGVLPAEMAINYSVSGPNLRASGVRYDVRRAVPYSIYDRFDFIIPVGMNGDCYDRYMVRVAEMRQSLRIIRQALDHLPKGPVASEIPRILRLPAGEVLSRIEASRGELGFYLVSDGSLNPWRFKVRSPSFINIGVFREIVRGGKVQDAIAILGSLDIIMGEVDR